MAPNGFAGSHRGPELPPPTPLEALSDADAELVELGPPPIPLVVDDEPDVVEVVAFSAAEHPENAIPITSARDATDERSTNRENRMHPLIRVTPERGAIRPHLGAKRRPQEARLRRWSSRGAALKSAETPGGAVLAVLGACDPHAVEWDDVRVLLALLREKSLKDAGKQLGLDASTVSRRVATLESAVGAPLFSRTREGLRPTATAERLRGHAEAMEQQATSIVRAVRAADTEAAGVVRVATTEAFARFLVSNGLLGLRASHPDVIVELLGGNQPVDLARGEADIALRLAALEQPSLVARSVARMAVGLFASHAYLRERGVARTVDDLPGHDVLLPTGELARLPEAKWLAARPRVRVAFRSNSMPTLVAAAVAGHGIVPLPVGWGDSEPDLARLLVLESIPRRKLWLVTPAAANRRPAVRVVSEAIVEILERVFRR